MIFLQATKSPNTTVSKDLIYVYHETDRIFAAPLATGGFLPLQKLNKSVRLKQIQLEQDTAKSSYSSVLEATQVDLNRAGAGLMEIVSEPDMRCVVARHYSLTL